MYVCVIQSILLSVCRVVRNTAAERARHVQVASQNDEQFIKLADTQVQDASPMIARTVPMSLLNQISQLSPSAQQTLIQQYATQNMTLPQNAALTQVRNSLFISYT